MLVAINIENAHLRGDIMPQLYRLRYKQFKERQGYNVSTYKGMEFDQFDTLATVHLVWVDEDGMVRGCSRLNPTTRPYMLKELWPQMVSGELPQAPEVWEGSRIGIDNSLPAALRERVKWELVLGYLEFGLDNGIRKYIGVMQKLIWHRVFIKSGWGAQYLGDPHQMDGSKTLAGQVSVSEEAYKRVQKTVGIYERVLKESYQIER